MTKKAKSSISYGLGSPPPLSSPSECSCISNVCYLECIAIPQLFLPNPPNCRSTLPTYPFSYPIQGSPSSILSFSSFPLNELAISFLSLSDPILTDSFFIPLFFSFFILIREQEQEMSGTAFISSFIWRETPEEGANCIRLHLSIQEEFEDL